MSVIYVVLPLALVFALVAVVVFVLQVRSGQLDDLDSPALRILHDDDPAPKDDPKSQITDSGDDDRG